MLKHALTTETSHDNNAEVKEPFTQGDIPAEKRTRRKSISLIPLGLLVFCAGLAIGVGGTVWRNNQQATVMTINGMPLRQQELLHRLEVTGSSTGPLGDVVVKQIISEELVLQYARKMGVLPTDAQVDAKYAEAEKQPNFQQNLTATHQTPADVKQSIRVNLAQLSLFSKDVTVNDEEIRQFYNKNVDPKNPTARYYQPEAVQIAVIVSQTEADSRKAMETLASGAPFETVARSYSKDKSATNGGLLPPVRKGNLDATKFPGLEKTLFSMKVGQQLNMVKLAGAWWIIRCVGRTTEQKVPFEKVQEECRTGALLTKGLSTHGATTQEQFRAFQKKADIHVNWPQYKDAAILN